MRILPLLLSCLFATQASAQSLAPYKDQLFGYPALLKSEGKTYRVVDYQETRDINGRDQVPERRVKSEYVSTGVRRVQNDLMLRTAAGAVRHFAVGQTTGASVIVLYLHGQGGSRKQGIDDFSFGGNFNRLKNLMVANGGLYLSPDFPDFDHKGTAQIKALIDHYAAQSPGAKVVVACGSMGGALCWGLAHDAAAAKRLGGLILLGSMWDNGFLSSPAFARRVPVFFGQGSEDEIFPIENQEAFFRSILARKPGYPARFVRFETGSHGTPIRMTDWRETLNWMLAAK